MNDYLTGSIHQLIARARHLVAKIPRHLPRDYDALSQACHRKIQEHLRQLRSLLEDADYLDPANQPERFRAFRRIVSDLDILESTGVAALSRAEGDDHHLTQLLEKVRREIRYPLAAPVVSSLSQQYFCVDTELNLLFVPLTEGKFLLHLPDLFHELGHPLAQQEDDPIVEPYQEALFRAMSVALSYIAEEVTKEARRRGPERPAFMLRKWRESWVKIWTEEFFCDLFAVNTLGPAYAWSHLHLTAKRGDDPFDVPVFRAASHPADDARMRAMLSALKLGGFDAEASAISAKWSELLAETGARPEPEYHRCFPDHLIADVVRHAREGTSAVGCRLAEPSTSDEVHSLLNSAWVKFWEDPENYAAWEEAVVRGLAP